jgi:antitoxin component of RelBE/YafQ-DinJ toxin-antitoxin module
MAVSKEQGTKEADKSKQGILHIRLDQELLDDSQALAKELGFNLSTHVRVLLRKALDERRKK